MTSSIRDIFGRPVPVGGGIDLHFTSGDLHRCHSGRRQTDKEIKFMCYVLLERQLLLRGD